MKHTLRLLSTGALPLLVLSSVAEAQLLPADTIVPSADTLGITVGVSQRRARLLLASGKTYNRVEGLPVQFGPVFSTGVGRARVNLEVFGILRSADTFEWDAANRGHILTANLQSDSYRGAGLKFASYDMVSAVEEWHMPAGEVGLASFFLHRDYRDYYGRHGHSLTASLFSGRRAILELALADERWSSRQVRQVLTVLRNNHLWRANPEADHGDARVLTVRALFDTRNDTRNPATGWLARIEYEVGDVELSSVAPRSWGETPVPELEPRYGRALVDVRRYNRVSPEAQLNFRLVAGGWLHGDELPLQRRFSVGGPGTIPGVGFRDANRRPDVFSCAGAMVPDGVPAQCERVLLLQAEYRDELPYRPGTIFGGTPVRIRSAALTMRPVLVLFADLGRGWLVTPDPVRSAEQRELLYGKARIPPLPTFSADLGLGVDLGLIGTYVVASITESGAPLRLFLRAGSRF